MGSLSVPGAFIAGVLSFASPCVAALIPAYVSYVSGLSVAELDRSHNFRRVMVSALLFCAGFAAVFIVLGASASAVGAFTKANRLLLAKIGGIVIIAFGLHVLRLIRIPLLDREARPMLGRFKAGSYLESPLIGMSFAIGWTPCVGTILGAVLLLASQTRTVGQGAALLGIYSAGLAVPFLIVTAALVKGLDVSFMRRHARKIEIASGLLLVVFGALLFSGQLTRVTGQLSLFVPSWLRL